MCSPKTLGNFSEQSLHNNFALFENEFCYEHVIKLVVGFRVNFTVNYLHVKKNAKILLVYLGSMFYSRI
jgi:hypothetical protein